ncbi:DNA-3-methyladenine glycosidase [Agaricicola taiwanensis]|uniref:DNA-3-methyladenine glycosylase II n=1 Tax=Agaricicola taiwanensis TaxID=591372 RepID=A0A8J2YLR8_9RHOB|nr:DNA-3-methyladenine glycosylase 2 family protein [Agaricicola taiwanensis]GGE51293.1 DNA-3-methyladenine glycosidase [Agaricicola taiwanensis]
MPLAALISLDPALAPLAVAAGELPDRRIARGYAGLAWVIIGQQISVAAARAIHARCETALSAITAEAVAGADDMTLKAAGLSGPKIRALRSVAEAVTSGALDLAGLAELEADEAIARMVAVKGIGPWTAEVYLLFALEHPDVFPAGDLALQEAARIGFGLEARPSPKALRERAEVWRPYRGLAARLLWAYYRVAKQGRDATPV